LAPSSGLFELSHINGDYYVLRPKPDGKAFAPGRHRSVKLRGSPWAINISDAPSGFYLLPGDRDSAAKPIAVPIEIKPFPDAVKLRRGANDRIDEVTAESRYRENESLMKIDPDRLEKVVPTPVESKVTEGRFRLTPLTTIFYDRSLASEARLLSNALSELLTGQVAVEPGIPNKIPPGSICLRNGEVIVAGRTTKNGDEAYALTVTPERIELQGTDAAAVFYATQSLRSLLPIESYRQKNKEILIDGIRIADTPRFRYRGLHLDVARNFQTTDTVKKLIDLMSFYKLNRLHLHLTDDEGWRIEIKQLPELTRIGSRRGHSLDEATNLVPSHGSGPDPNALPGSGYYSQNEFQELLQFAAKRHVAIMPEIDLPGHARAAVKSMENRQRLLSHSRHRKATSLLLRDLNDKSKYESVQLWRDNVVDVGREDTYQFVKIVVDELGEIYKRAGVPLISVHLGGDEVPKGAWEKSPACEKVPVNANAKASRTNQLERHFLQRACEILGAASIQPACWEDCLLLDVDSDSSAGDALRAAGKPIPTAYVWNNVWGWGREDAAYRLANAGFDVVLCNATNLYFDLACEKDPHEFGYYWAGFVGTRAPFEFVPLDIYKNATQTNMGQPIDEKSLADRVRLTAKGTRHILGIQGQLWGENLRDALSLEYMGFPRIIALAERAWARSPDWAQITDRSTRNAQLQDEWNKFANYLGQRELPRLDYMSGGVQYRLPPPGVTMRDGKIHANVSLPGLVIRYTTDGTQPKSTSLIYEKPITRWSTVKLRTFSSRGRGSRSETITPAKPR
jgi:hexosaminidase